MRNEYLVWNDSAGVLVQKVIAGCFEMTSPKGDWTMKIAITSTGPTLDDNISTEFADSRYLLIIDFDTLDYEALISPVIAYDGPAAGRLLAQHLLKEGVSKILASHVNSEVLDSFLKTLQGVGIQVVDGVSDSGRSAVIQFKEMCSADTVVIPCEDIIGRESAA